MMSEEKWIRSKAQLREFLEVEYQRYPISGRRYLFYLMQFSEGAILRKHTKLLRTTEYHLNTGHKLRTMFYRLRLMRLQNRYYLRIPLNSFDKGLRIIHLLPVGANGNISVGKNCTMLPNSFLTGDNTAEDRAPRLGDNVTLGIGSLVVGDVELADGITVGAGAVVTKSFPEPNINIAGVPARKVGSKDAAE